jgi:hypothetical protein
LQSVTATALAITGLEFEEHVVLADTVMIAPGETDEHTPVYAGKIAGQLWEAIYEMLLRSNRVLKGCSMQ